MTALMLALLAAAPISVPKQGENAATSVETPAGPISVSFEDAGAGVTVRLKGATAALKGAALELSPVFEPGKFKTRRFDGERWKCVGTGEGKEKWITESHDDLLTTREVLRDEHFREDPARIFLLLRGAVSATTDKVRVRLVIPKVAPAVFQLQLERPYALPPAVAEMLKQYQKAAPAAVLTEGRWERFKIARVRKNECNDPSLFEDSFEVKTIQTLAFPSHEWRLLTSNGWVFAEAIETHRDSPILAEVDFSRLDPKNMTYLGDLYSRELKSVDTSPGKAVATFELGDFSGCFGASCGTPVNVREAVVTFAGGTLSTKINRPKSGE
jgi:hypothetical protein